MTMITIRRERTADAAAREPLLDAAYGPVRFTKPSQRLRDGREPADGLSFVAVEDGRVVGTRPALDGHGRRGPAGAAARPARRRSAAAATAASARRLMRRALRDAERRGHRAVLLVGDASYYGRFGFSAAKTGSLGCPGPTTRTVCSGSNLSQARSTAPAA